MDSHIEPCVARESRQAPYGTPWLKEMYESMALRMACEAWKVSNVISPWSRIRRGESGFP